MGMPASREEADVVVLFGGDGTIHRHLGQLVKLGLPVLVVPAGSGNDFASSLGLRKVRDSLAAWGAFCGGKSAHKIDLGVIHQLSGDSTHEMSGAHYFCCVAGVGIDSAVAERANRMPRWLRGHGGYVLSLAPAIFTFVPFPMKIQTAESDISNEWIIRSDQPTLLAAFANAPLYGGGMKVAPRAKMDDGLLDVCLVGGVDPFKLFCMFPTVYAGKHLSIKEVDYFQVGRARVETEYPMDVYADGEFVCRTPIEVSVERQALKVIAPA